MANYTNTTLTEVEKSNLFSEFNNKTLNLDTVEEKDPRYKEFVNQTTGQNLLVNALRAGDYSYLNTIPDSYRGQESFMLPLLFAVKNGPNVTFAVFSYFSPELQNDPELGKMIIKDEPHLINNTPLASNKEFIIENAKHYPAILQYASPILLNDPTFKKEAYEQGIISNPIQAASMAPVAAAIAISAADQILQGETNKGNYQFAIKDDNNFKTFDQKLEDITKGVVKQENLEQAIYAAKAKEGTLTLEEFRNKLEKTKKQVEERQHIPQNMKSILGAPKIMYSEVLSKRIKETLTKQGIDFTQVLPLEEEVNQEFNELIQKENEIILEGFKEFTAKTKSLNPQSKEFKVLIKEIIPEDIKDTGDSRYQRLHRLIKGLRKQLSPEEYADYELTLSRISDHIIRTAEIEEEQPEIENQGNGLIEKQKEKILKRMQSIKQISRDEAIDRILENFNMVRKYTNDPDIVLETKETYKKLKAIIDTYESDVSFDRKKFESILSIASHVSPEDFDKIDVDILFHDKKAPTQPSQIAQQPEAAKPVEPEQKKGTPADAAEMTKELASSDITDTMNRIRDTHEIVRQVMQENPVK